MITLVQNTRLGVVGLLAILGLGAHPASLLAQDLASWGESLELDARVIREIMRFEGGEALGPAQAETFARAVRSQLIPTATNQVAQLLTGDCEPFVHVTIGESEFLMPEGVPAGEEKRWEKFVESLIRREMVACLETDRTDPQEVLQMYVSPEFRMAAESRITDMWVDEEGGCMETKGVLSLVEPTRICNRIDDFRGEGVAAEHSQVVFNEGRKPYEEVHFKESLKTFLKTPGGMALHYINYTRAGKKSRLSRGSRQRTPAAALRLLAL